MPQNNTGSLLSVNVAGWRRAQAAVNGIRFLFSSGNIASGTITMYGLRIA